MSVDDLLDDSFIVNLTDYDAVKEIRKQNIKEIRKYKDVAERDIRNILINLAENTGLVVRDITLYYRESIGERTNELSDLTINLTLEL